MSSSLPTESAVDSAVQQFGLGPYDSNDDGVDHGEDKNQKLTSRSLPDGGGSDVQCPDRLMSYPDEHPALASISRLTYDPDHVHISQESGLPDDHDNPSARCDYSDRSVISQVSDLWPDEDCGAFAGETIADSSLPGVTKNEVSMDDFLGALGNFWSGYEIEDISPTQGFPSTDLSENCDYPRSNDGTSGGRLVALGSVDMEITDMESVLSSFNDGHISIGTLYDMMVGTNTGMRAATGRTAGELIDLANTTPTVARKATNIELAGELTEKVLKEYGKKNLTKRQILSYLQSQGQPQFLSSDIIRCLKHRHEVYIKDVLDEFPVAKQASSSGNFNISSMRDHVIGLELRCLHVPEISSILRRVAASLSVALVSMEKLGDRNGQ